MCSITARSTGTYHGRNPLVDVWLAGFASGAASALKQSQPTMDDETARKIADRICAAITDDRVAMDRVRLLVEERLKGGNGTHMFTVYVP